MNRIRIHDLIELRSPFLIEQSAKPEWVESALRSAPFVVARRGDCSASQIVVGVRGPERHHRWPGFVSPENVNRVLSPAWIRDQSLDSDFSGKVNGFFSFQALCQKWRHLEYDWGPSGSVGFELVTGIATATETSDLDIVLYAPTPMPSKTIEFLSTSTKDLPSRVDVLIETPSCGFALSEYSAAHGAAILLRTSHGRIFGSDPWGLDLWGSNPDRASLDKDLNSQQPGRSRTHESSRG